MAVTEKTKAIDQAILQIEKQFGKGSIMKLGDSGGEKTHFELSQVLLPAAVGVGNQGMDGNAAFDGTFERPFQFLAVEAEDDDFNGFLGFFNTAKKRADTVTRLCQKFHSRSKSTASHRNAPQLMLSQAVGLSDWSLRLHRI